ncbi:MAG: hypothetical protein FWC87_00145 [Acidimicrobiaceae bacterium]|nr:hypothetical protein [Acidimicrobiaceae bacterium]
MNTERITRLEVIIRTLVFRQPHHWANALAWRYAEPPGPDFGKALRIDRHRLLWRLNDWLADRYIHQYVTWRYQRRTS